MNHQELLDEIQILARVRTDERPLWGIIRLLVVELADQDRRLEHLERTIRPEVKD